MAKFYYTINENIIDYTDSERDLGIWVNSKFKWDQQQESVLNKAHQMLGIIKRTCNFITDVNKRRSLYISLVRSQFEHCSIIWRPHNETEISGFEKLQKKAIKWIFNEHIQHYDDELYLNRCSQVNLIPMLAFFDINDLVFFHKIINNKIPMTLPSFLQPYIGQGRLRNANLDSLSFSNNLHREVPSASSRSPFYKSFFYKIVHTWNSLPFSIRSIPDSPNFKYELISHIWGLLRINSAPNP